MACVRVARKSHRRWGWPGHLFIATAVVLAGCHSGDSPLLSSGAPSFRTDPPVTITSSGPSTYTVDFGNVAIGVAQPSGLTLTNVGTSPLQLLGLEVPTNPEFSANSPSSSLIQTGVSVAIPLSFRPATLGSKSDSLVVHSDSASLPDVTLVLTGSGVSVELDVSPPVAAFGNVVIHTTATIPLTLFNNSAVDLKVTPSAVQGGAASLFTLDQSAVIVLPAGQSTRLMVTYAPLMPSLLDVAYFTLSLGTGNPIGVTLQGTALQSGLAESPSPLDFGFVQPGDQLTLPLHLQNVGNQPLSLSSIAVSNPGVPAAFSLSSGAPQSAQLAPGQSLDVNVDFLPTQKQSYEGTLQIVGGDTVQLSVALQGYGGGAVLSCAPLDLAFGVSPVGIATSLPIICTNTGSDVIAGGSPDVNAELKITGLSVTAGSSFVAALDPAAIAGPLRAGQSTRIDVSYAATQPNGDTATLTIQSNALNPVVVPLSGQGVVEQKCFYAVSPTTLDWGEVRPGSTATQAFTVTNTGPNECLVTGVALTADSDPAFTLPQGVLASQRLSAPGTGGLYPTALVVQVAFTPPLQGAFSGRAAFTVSDPAAPGVQVPLLGSAADNCFLVKPAELDFGVVGLSNGQFCSSVHRSFVGVNGCTTNVNLTTLTLASAVSPFVVVSDVLPATIAPGQTSPPFEIGFTPSAAGSYAGAAMLQTDLQAVPFGVFFQGGALDGTQQTDRFQGRTPKVDVLFVSDTDDDAQFLASFAQHSQDFVAEAENLNLDFQMAVTTTDVCGNDGEQGRLLPCPGCHIDGPTPKFVTNQDATAGRDLAFLLPGADGGLEDGCLLGGHDEQLFEAAFETLLTNASTYNAGFIRPDAYLAVVQVNGDDETDNSVQNTVQWYANQYLSIKGVDHPELFSWSYINPSQFGSTDGRQPFNRLPSRIAAMLDLVGGVALDTTQDQWWVGLTDLWVRAAATSSQFPLSGVPDPASIQVYLDGPPPGQTAPGEKPGVLIPPLADDGQPNYLYDGSANSLDINSASLSLGAADLLYVTYTLVCS